MPAAGSRGNGPMRDRRDRGPKRCRSKRTAERKKEGYPWRFVSCKVPYLSRVEGCHPTRSGLSNDRKRGAGCAGEEEAGRAGEAAVHFFANLRLMRLREVSVIPRKDAICFSCA